MNFDIEVENNTNEGLESNNTEATEQTNTSQELMDLDSVEKFRFAGREWTPKDLQSAYMMQSDYTRKTQAISEERKYYDNLEYDLANVRNNPALAEQFLRIYPAKFHKLLDYVTNGTQQTQQNSNNNNGHSNNNGSPNGIDPNFYREFQQLKADMIERNVQAIQAELDSKFASLQKKYPMADEEAVLARAEYLLNQGRELNDKTWDALWKSINDRNESLAKQYYSGQVNKQKTANLKGKDVSPGGGIPGQAPRKPKTLAEASKFVLEDLENI